jgi:hypothetical protein
VIAAPLLETCPLADAKRSTFVAVALTSAIRQVLNCDGPQAGPLAVTGMRARYDRPHVDDHRKPFFGYETALMALSAHQLRRHGY